MNEVNGGDTVFVRCVVSVCLSVCLCCCVCTARIGVRLNANSSKMVKATDFKFHKRGVPRNSPDITPKLFEKVRGQGHVTP